MGIKRMNKFLEDNNLIKIHNNINDFIRNSKKLEFQVFNTRNKCYRIAVDTILYAHKFKYSYNDIAYGFINQIINFLSNRIIPVYIIDGIAPIEKSDIIKSRNNKKDKIDFKIENLEKDLLIEIDPDKIKLIKKKIFNLKKSNIKISKEDLDEIILITQSLGVPCIRANGEADSLIGKLYENKSIDACLSEDMDILIFGCKKMIKFSNKKIYEYDLDFILFKLGITYNDFLDMCILFGCDYLKPIAKLDTKYIYENILNKNINNLIKDNVGNDNFNKYIIEFENAKSIFLNSIKKEVIENKIFKIKKNINEDELYQFILKSNLFKDKKKSEIKANIIYINNLIKDNKFI